jgi:DNA-binding SARP family transcriptional activator
MIHLALRLLGGFEVRMASGASVDFPTKKAKALLAHLARYPGQRISREKLATLLWANSDDAHACVSLRQTLTLLRKSLSHLRMCVRGQCG